MVSLKSSPLYRVEHVLNRIRSLGTGPLSVPQLLPFDQLHYLGTDTLDEMARAFSLGAGSEVLDIGSGLGGPARYLAWRHGCRVTGVELQEDFFQTAIELTARVRLDGRVDFMLGDIVSIDLGGRQFDHAFSLLVFLHIPDRPRLFAACARALRPGGTLYIEDFYQRRPFRPDEERALREVVACPGLPTDSRYLADLSEAGYGDIAMLEITPIWRPWVAERHERFRADLAQHLSLHGPEMTAALDRFYGVMSELFAGGNLGGVRISARRA
jgi:SAM-dependent methyltransferase